MCSTEQSSHRRNIPMPALPYRLSPISTMVPVDIAAGSQGILRAGSINDAVGGGINLAKAGVATVEAVGRQIPAIGNRGDGQDFIADWLETAPHLNTLSFKEGIAPADLAASRSGTSLVLGIKGTADGADSFVCTATSQSAGDDALHARVSTSLFWGDRHHATKWINSCLSIASQR